jgi:tetratricopeptide (TPR) repeat protein
MRTLKLLPLVVVSCSWVATASAQQVGDTIVVITEDAPLRSQNATTGIVPKGSILVVRNVNDDWFWVISTSGKTGTVKGWINRSDVIPFSQALDFFYEEVRRNPSAAAYNIRGMIWNQKGEYDIAIADFNEAIRLDPHQSRYYNARGKTRCLKSEYDQALADLNEAIRLDPKFPQAYCNRGSAWLGKKQYDKAIVDYNEALRLDPQDAMIYNNRGDTWNEKKEYDKALSDCRQAIRLDPTLPPAYNNRGVAWDGKGEYDKALSDFNEAIRLDPKNARQWNNRAWLAATCSDAKYRGGQQAVADARKACELTGWKDGDLLGTLAAAYAEVGDFPNAVNWAEKAVELGPDKSKGELRSHLDLFKAHKPYHEDVKK